MNLNIDLSDEKTAALASQARAAHMPTERYLAHIVENALDRQHRRSAEQLGEHLTLMASHIQQDTTTEQMEAALEEALAAVRPHRSWRL